MTVRCLALIAMITSACVNTTRSHQVRDAPRVEYSEDTFAILLAAGPSILSQLNPQTKTYHVADSLTAKLLTRLNAQNSFTRIGPNQTVSCDGHTPITGTLFHVSLREIEGDSASVGWSLTCVLRSRYHPDGFLGGGASSYNLHRVKNRWTVSGPNMYYLEF